MQLRKVTPQVGRTAWFGASPVTIVAIDQAPVPNVTVRDTDGVESTHRHFDLDTGFEYRGHSGWVHESDPRVLQWLRDELAQMRAKQVPAALMHDHHETMRLIQIVLERNKPDR